MPRRSLNELAAQAQLALPDNVSELISPADVRLMFTDFIDTMAPSYGALGITTRAQAVNNIPAAIIFQTAITSFPPEWGANAVTGQINRQLAGVPKLNSQFIICGSVIGPSGTELSIVLYKNGVPLVWGQVLTTRGSGNREGFAFTAIDVSDVDSIYELRASTKQAAPAQFTFENVLWGGENIPIRDFATPVEIPTTLRYLAPDLDLDLDTLPDTWISNPVGGPDISEDADSTNIDTNEDGVADIVIPKP